MSFRSLLSPMIERAIRRRRRRRECGYSKRYCKNFNQNSENLPMQVMSLYHSRSFSTMEKKEKLRFRYAKFSLKKFRNFGVSCVRISFDSQQSIKTGRLCKFGVFKWKYSLVSSCWLHSLGLPLSTLSLFGATHPVKVSHVTLITNK